MIYVVYEKDTKEVMAIVGDIEDFVMRNDIEVNAYKDTWPVFEDIDGKIYLKENTIIIDPIKGGYK